LETTEDLVLGPEALVQLNHPTMLPVYPKVHHYEHHPREGPSIVLLSGGSGARTLSETLVRYTHNSSHVLPMFDDGGSSRVLRERLDMPPPGDLRNRLMALSDLSKSGNPEVSRLFRTRLPRTGGSEKLRRILSDYLAGEAEEMRRIESPYRHIIVQHLRRFAEATPPDFDLRGGNIGNFVIAGAYLAVRNLESVIFEFSALAAARGRVFPVCDGAHYHLRAQFKDGTAFVGQSRITGRQHPPISRLSIVEPGPGGRPVEAAPTLNPRAEEAILDSALVAYTMGSFYTSLVSNMLVRGMGRTIRRTRRPKVFVANLTRDRETPHMTVSRMLEETLRYLQASDDEPGDMKDYVHYALVGAHGESDQGGRVPVDLPAIRRLGVEPIELPLERTEPDGRLVHRPGIVAATLISLC